MRRWIGPILCTFAVGCISTSVARLDSSVRPARSPDSVTVLFEQPARPYTVIAVISSDGKTIFDSYDDMRKAMVVEAAKLGGDGLILGSENTESEFVFTGQAMIESDTKNLSGAVIVFRPSE
jgi:hypothetical protein